MPLTFPAHQGLIAPVKLKWPKAIDGTALCIAAAAPDFAYPLDRWIDHRSHSIFGLVVWAIPFTMLAAVVARRWAAAGVFAVAPDLGPLRLRSYRVLGTRRPNWLITLASTVLGSASHIVIDAFTHRSRWGSDLAGLNDVLIDVPGRGPLTEAQVLQYLGHGFGSIAFVVVLMVISSRGRLEAWYGAGAVARARNVTVERSDRLWFAAIVLVPTVASIPVAQWLFGWVRFEPLTTMAIAVLLAGTFVGRRRPIADDESDPDHARALSQAPQTS